MDQNPDQLLAEGGRHPDDFNSEGPPRHQELRLPDGAIRLHAAYKKSKGIGRCAVVHHIGMNDIIFLYFYIL
jgi:hypothetical protein